VRRIPQWPRLAAFTVTAHEMDKGTGFVYFLLDLFAQFSQAGTRRISTINFRRT
jgi:hypothetical protein